MAGHSKWANIKRRKGKADLLKGKLFSRAAKEIISSVKLGGADPRSNSRLWLAIQKARAANMPNENIDRNIKKAVGQEQADYHEITYELYGHGGVGIVVEVMSDNKNRIASDIRIATNKRGGSIAAPGAVTFNFDRKGVIYIPQTQAIEEELFALVTELGAEDFEGVDEIFVVVTDPKDLLSVKEGLVHRGIACEEADFEWIPKVYMTCDEERVKENLALIEWLEGIEDVDAVFHNLKLPD